MLASNLFVLFTLALSSNAKPVALGTPPYCQAINAAVNKVKALSTATPFCSSFLHISTITSTVSTTTTRYAYLAEPRKVPF